MIYFKVVDGKVVEIAASLNSEQHSNPQWKSRWDIPSFAKATEYAKQISELTGKPYTAIDSGPCVSPRYDVGGIPQIGDKVSYSFNGDSYPDGVIVAITDKLQVTTSEGHKYRRRGLTGTWLRTGGTWSLIQGHHYEQNPHF